MRETFGARDPRSWRMRFHTQTAGVSLTDVQPEVNLVRVAVQALAAALGGTQSLHTDAMDEALALPSEKAARLAVRTQQVILHETGVANTIDPLGGSYALESLTNQRESTANALITRIDAMGGAVAAIGHMKSALVAANSERLARIEAGFIQTNVDFMSIDRALRPSRGRSPFELGLGWLVDLEKGHFNGRRALLYRHEPLRRPPAPQHLPEGREGAPRRGLFSGWR
jgi:methylmalonyl-CoA mutase N-terminal domain/subunit